MKVANRCASHAVCLESQMLAFSTLPQTAALAAPCLLTLDVKPLDLGPQCPHR